MVVIRLVLEDCTALGQRWPVGSTVVGRSSSGGEAGPSELWTRKLLARDNADRA
jgi:hypothetical protein